MVDSHGNDDLKRDDLERRVKLAVLDLIFHEGCGGFSLEMPTGDGGPSYWVVVGPIDLVSAQAAAVAGHASDGPPPAPGRLQ